MARSRLSPHRTRTWWPGSDLYPRTPVSPEPWRTPHGCLQPEPAASRRSAPGAFILAAAGLLAGKRATTHWQVTRELAARCPTCRVEPDAIYVRDGSTYTSAGVTAGIDLALALVEEDHGPDLTRDVARALVVYMQRSGGQSQFSAPLQGPPTRSPALRRITDLVTANPKGKPLARRARETPQREHPSPHPALPRRTVHDAGQVRGEHPLRYGQGAARPGAERDAGRDSRRVPQLREHAKGLRKEAVDQPCGLPAPVQHSSARSTSSIGYSSGERTSYERGERCGLGEKGECDVCNR